MDRQSQDQKDFLVSMCVARPTAPDIGTEDVGRVLQSIRAKEEQSPIRTQITIKQPQ